MATDSDLTSQERELAVQLDAEAELRKNMEGAGIIGPNTSQEEFQEKLDRIQRDLRSGLSLQEALASSKGDESYGPTVNHGDETFSRAVHHSSVAEVNPKSDFQIAAQPEAKEMQSYLRVLGYPTGKIDGKIGDKTNTALSMFKEESGLENASQAEVLAALREKMRAPEGQAKLNAIIDANNRHTYSEDVKAAQTAMNSLNDKSNSVKVDGYSGEQTVWGSEKLKDKLALAAPAAAPEVLDMGEIVVTPENAGKTYDENGIEIVEEAPASLESGRVVEVTAGGTKLHSYEGGYEPTPEIMEYSSEVDLKQNSDALGLNRDQGTKIDPEFAKSQIKIEAVSREIVPLGGRDLNAQYRVGERGQLNGSYNAEASRTLPPGVTFDNKTGIPYNEANGNPVNLKTGHELNAASVDTNRDGEISQMEYKVAVSKDDIRNQGGIHGAMMRVFTPAP